MKSLYFRNFLLTAGMVVLSFFILGISFVVLARVFMISEKHDNLDRTAEEAVRLIKADFAGEQPAEGVGLQMVISSLSSATGNQVFVCDYDGVVIYCSDAYYCVQHVGRSVNEQIIGAVRQNGTIQLQTALNGFYNKTHYVSAHGVYFEGYADPVFYVFASSDSNILTGAWHTFMMLFFAAALAIIMIALTISLVTSKKQAMPINEIAAAARNFAHGDYSVRVHEDSGRADEIGELASAFNAMAHAIEVSDRKRSEFIANVSHELKTPMTTIAGFADGILDGTIPRENQEKYLKTISEETKRLARLVRRMLDLSRISFAEEDELRKSSFDVSEVLRQTLIYFENKITERGLDVDASLPEDSILVYGDKDAVTQVVYNLLENAIKFAKADSSIGLSLWKTGVKAFVSIKNEGEDIPEEEIPLLFDRFHKTDRSRSRDRDGVGLGLYIVKSILGNHDEDITVTSRDGVTEFVFTLTLAPQKQSK